MGWASCQEDNLDAKGEPVKIGKKKVPVMTIEELDSETKVKNTVIIKADGLASNSIEIESYHFDVAFMDDDGQLSPQIDLTASEEKADGTGRVVKIARFYDIKEACALLTDLMLAIENQEAVFNVSARHIKGKDGHQHSDSIKQELTELVQQRAPDPLPPVINDFNRIRNAFREYVERESTILRNDGGDAPFVKYKSGIPNPNGNGLSLIWIQAWVPEGDKISAAISVAENGPFWESHYQGLKANKSKIEHYFSFDNIETDTVGAGIHQFRVNKMGVDLTQTANWETEFRWLRENLEKLYWVLEIQDTGNGWNAL